MRPVWGADSARMTGNPDTTSAPSSRGKEAADDGAWINEKAQEPSGVSSGPRSSEISCSKHLEFGGHAAWLPPRDRRIHRGIKTPFDYSVFSAAAAAFSLAFREPDRFTLDKLLNRLRTEREIRSRTTLT